MQRGGSRRVAESAEERESCPRHEAPKGAANSLLVFGAWGKLISATLGGVLGVGVMIASFSDRSPASPSSCVLDAHDAPGVSR